MHRVSLSDAVAERLMSSEGHRHTAPHTDGTM
jgi:hypothetical protein